MSAQPEYAFDRFLRYDELVGWLRAIADANPNLVTIEQYGSSFEGRPLLLVTITDTSTGAHQVKPAHWVDANIHAVELTASVAACHLIHTLVDGHRNGDERIVRALKTRTFYVVPRVNPDGAEWVLADRPKWRRSSTRPWPWRDDTAPWPGQTTEDIDGDGRVLQMRIADPTGAWMPHPDDARLMVAVPAEGAPAGITTYRLLTEGAVHGYDGYTIPRQRQVEGLDMNRNFPSGWGAQVGGSGDHALSEPEIDALVRALAARPNVCGYNAYHTSGGVLLRPSSTKPDSQLEPYDIWAWGQLGAFGTEKTGYPVHGVFEDFTWDKRDTMGGAGDDFAYENRGVFAWTTEFWDAVQAATGAKSDVLVWYTGPTNEQALAVLHWCDANYPDGFVDWYPFQHPTLGAVELGGWNELTTWINPPPHLLPNEIAGHADFAIHQALCAPELSVGHTAVTALGADTFRVEVGVANVGFLATDVTAHARKHLRVLPVVAELTGDGVTVIGGEPRQQLGQLDGRSEMRFGPGNDRTPDRVLAGWTVTGSPGTVVTVTARHERAGTVSVELRLGT